MKLNDSVFKIPDRTKLKKNSQNTFYKTKHIYILIIMLLVSLILIFVNLNLILSYLLFIWLPVAVLLLLFDGRPLYVYLKDKQTWKKEKTHYLRVKR